MRESLTPIKLAQLASLPSAGTNTRGLFAVGSHVYFDDGTTVRPLDLDPLGTFTASEALTAGNLINVFDNAGVFSMRKADASAANKYRADGFVLANVSSGAVGTAYGGGTLAGLSGLVAGMRYLSATTPGATVDATTALAYTGGKLFQEVGIALSATSLAFTSSGLLLIKEV